jgi:uncharacterized repeat protein (TIGR03803 family)
MKQTINALRRLNAPKRVFAVFVLCVITAMSLPAQIFTTLHNFNYNNAAGLNPAAGLVQAANGGLYGTTQFGGGANGKGTVFKITTGGRLTTLYTFHDTDGAAPQTRLLLANGSLYGTTFEGGMSNGTSYCILGCGTIFKIAADGTLATLHSFNGIDGYHPSTLVQATDGDFYGTTYSGGANGDGTVFKITPSGILTTLYSFCSQPGCTDGTVPNAGLVQADNGDFYGTTTNAGAGPFCVPGSGGGCGTVFKITPGGALTTLYSFCSQPNCSDGSSPAAELVQANNGDLYGTTTGGGGVNPFPCFDGCGTVFKITLGGALTTLYRFSGNTDGERPSAALTQATDGNFYGTTIAGSGASGGGTIFKVTPTGKLTTLHGFNASTDGLIPQDPLVEARSGTFYGTAMDGGSNNAGTVFSLEVFVRTLPTVGDVGSAVKILGTNLTGATSVTFNGIAADFEVVSPTQIVTTVPPGASTGEVQVVLPGGTLSEYQAHPGAIVRSLRKGANHMKRIINNALWGLNGGKRAFALFVLCATTAISSPAQVYTNLHTFTGGTDGGYPNAGLVQASNGAFYGTTYFGGANGRGAIFKITPSGTLTTLHSFKTTDGELPAAGLVLGNVALYGTTVEGGAGNCSLGCGTVFKLAADGTLTTLHSFNGTDGQDPYAGLALANNGEFYGTTRGHGANAFGTIFKISPSGTLTTLHSFCSQANCTDGRDPFAGLVQATDGNFYGTTSGGGFCPFTGGCGTVFKITPKGVLTTLYSFCSQANCTDGENPNAMLQATDGNFYGTTSAGGTGNSCFGGTGGCGTVFKITPSGALTTLHSFCSQVNCTEGEEPLAPLIQATDGNFYGTTEFGGGGGGQGTIFKITPTGELTTLHSFGVSPGDGTFPLAPLVEARSGTFYGTTSGGPGNAFNGTVFQPGSVCENASHLRRGGVGRQDPGNESDRSHQRHVQRHSGDRPSGLAHPNRHNRTARREHRRSPSGTPGRYAFEYQTVPGAIIRSLKNLSETE